MGRLVSSALERVDQQTRLDQSKKDLETKVNQLMKVAKTASEGNLTVAVEVKGDDDMGRLGEALGRMIADLKHVISQVIESASQFAEGSRVVAESAELPERVGPEPGGHRRGNVRLDPAALPLDSWRSTRTPRPPVPRRPRRRNWPSTAASRSNRRSRPWS